MSAPVVSILSEWRDWPLPLNDQPVIKAKLEAGQTNRNYRLEAPGLDEDLLLRLHRRDAGRLGIDRDRELTITRMTAEAGIGRPVWHWTRDYSILPFIEARPWTDTDFSDPGQRSRLWPLIEQLAALDTGQARRRYSDYLKHYWNQLENCSALDRSLRREWSAFWPDLLAFDEAAWSAGLVHHDLIPDNVLDTGSRLILIDWEYAAMGDPDIDRWSLDPAAIDEPFVAELMTWINRLWERLVRP